MDKNKRRELPLDEISVVFYMPKTGLDFETSNFVLRELENRGANITIATYPFGLIDNRVIPIVSDISIEDILAENFLCLIICPSQIERTDGEDKCLKMIIEEFHSHGKVLVFVGNTRKMLFEMKLEEIGDVVDLEENNFRIGNCFYSKKGDMVEFAEHISEYLIGKDPQQTLV